MHSQLYLNFLFIDLEANKFNRHNNDFVMAQYLKGIEKHVNLVQETSALPTFPFNGDYSSKI